MVVQTVRVSGKGQIAIPAKIRRRLGLRPGSTLLLIQGRGCILVTKPGALGDAVSDLTRQAEGPFQNLWDNKADEVWNDAIP